jgi:hypothetical protein
VYFVAPVTSPQSKTGLRLPTVIPPMGETSPGGSIASRKERTADQAL